MAEAAATSDSVGTSLELAEIVEGRLLPIRQGISRGANPFVVCWGDHDGACPLMETYDHDPARPHGLVTELDYDDPAHRMLLRWLREAARQAWEVRPVPRVVAGASTEWVPGTRRSR